MFRTLRHMKILCAAALLAGTAACGGPSEDSNKGTVNGRVENTGAMPVDGAAITAYRVEADGSLTAISSGNVQTSADGTYSVVVELASDTMSDIVIVADNNGAEGSVIVSGELSSGGSITAAPIDSETTVETDVYIEANAEGNWDSSCTTAQLRTWISAEMAAAIEGSTDYAGTVQTWAQATTSAMVSWSGTLAHEAVGATSAEIEAALEGGAQAQASLDAQLHAAQSQAEIDAALEAHAEATIQAYADAGITVEQMSNASQAAMEAMVTYAGDLSADARARAISDAEQTRGLFVQAAVEARFEAMAAAGAAQQNVVQAGETLQADLEAAASAGASAAADVEAAWSDYRASVETELEATVSAGAQTALSQVESAIATAETTLDGALAAISASADADVVANATVDAFGVFYASAFAQANTTTLVTAGLDEADARAVIQVLVSVSASAG